MDTYQFAEDLGTFLVESVKIDPLDLNREFVEMPARLAYWNSNFADATERWLTAKADYESAKAAARLRYRFMPRPDGKLPSKEDVDAMIVLDEEVRAAQTVFISASVDKTRVQGIVESLCTKRDMLQSFGAKIRAELRGDPMLRDQMTVGSVMDFGVNEQP